MEFLLDPAVLVAFASLVILEIILGVDNVIFIIVLSDRLPEHQRPTARRLGIGMALVSRILLLFSISWIMNLTQPALTIPFVEHTLTWRDLARSVTLDSRLPGTETWACPAVFSIMGDLAIP